MDCIQFDNDPRLKIQGVPDLVKMNQLQNLLHDSLIATQHVQSCAIVKRKEATLRANSVGFTLSSEQMRTLLDAFQNTSKTRESGLVYEGRQYECIRADVSSIYAKCVSGHWGKRGLIMVRTATLMLLATYNDTMCPSICVEAIEKLGDYFKEKGR